MFEIRPPLLESHGLGHAVGDLVDQTRRDLGVQVAVTIDVARLSTSVESLVYRTVQELVANARKHARATRLQVSLTASDGRLEGSVEDDGSGFDPTRARDRSVMRLHLGLQAVAERLRLAGGDFSIESRPGGGTTARFGLPTALMPRACVIVLDAVGVGTCPTRATTARRARRPSRTSPTPSAASRCRRCRRWAWET